MTAAPTCTCPPACPTCCPVVLLFCLVSSGAATNSLKCDLAIFKFKRREEKCTWVVPGAFASFPIAQYLNFAEHPSIMQPLTCPRKASKPPACPCVRRPPSPQPAARTVSRPTPASRLGPPRAGGAQAATEPENGVPAPGLVSPTMLRAHLPAHTGHLQRASGWDAGVD